MRDHATEENPYHGLPLESGATSARSPRLWVRSLTEMFLVAQVGVAVAIWIWDAKKTVLVLLYAFVLVFFVRAVERSLFEEARARRWRSTHSRFRAWVFCVAAAAGAWPFADAAFGSRPGPASIVFIGLLATAGPILAGLLMWQRGTRTVRSDTTAWGPLLLQSLVAAVALGFATATIAPLVLYWVLSFVAIMAPCLGTVALLLGVYAVVHHARPVPSEPAAYRTALWLAVFLAAIIVARGLFDSDPGSPLVPAGSAVLAVVLAATVARQGRRLAYSVAAIVFASSTALSKHWLDTVAFALTAVVVATGPLLDSIRHRHAEDHA